jgi:hypothetical protein
MGTKGRRSILSRIPNWGLSLLTVILSAILIGFIHNVVGDTYGYIIYNVSIVAACFLICWKGSGHVWYVPILCNILSIFTLSDNTFWITSMWIIFCTGWGLSLIGAIIGTQIRRREAKRTT